MTSLITFACIMYVLYRLIAVLGSVTNTKSEQEMANDRRRMWAKALDIPMPEDKKDRS